MTSHYDVKNVDIQSTVQDLVKNYLSTVEPSKVDNLYNLVMEQIEPPLLKATIENHKYNQSKAAKALGLSRGTTRTKLIKYFGDQYCGSMQEETS
jgi:Fis family transcriptional regulator